MPVTTDRPNGYREAYEAAFARNTRLCQLIRDLEAGFEQIAKHTTCEGSRAIAVAAVEKVGRDLQ